MAPYNKKHGTDQNEYNLLQKKPVDLTSKTLFVNEKVKNIRLM